MADSENGRPKIEIDMDQLAAFMRLKPTADDTAAYFKCSVSTIERRIREKTRSDENPEGLTFDAFRAINMVHTRFSIIRTAIKKAQNGDNDMIKYTLDNLSDDWRSKKMPDTVVNNTNKNTANTFNGLSKDDPDYEAKLDARIAEYEAKKKESAE